MKAHKIAASLLGIGFVRGGGTLAALVTCLIWYGLQREQVHPDYAPQVAAVIAVTALGIWNGNVVERDWGKDSSRVVIDEVAGQCAALALVPVISWKTVLAGLALFRFFDIAKPLGIRRAEALKGGWGVMADDLLAGVYANIVLQIIVHEKWL